MPGDDRPVTRNCEGFALASRLLITAAMKRLVGVLSVVMFAAACGVGDPDDGSTLDPDPNPLGRQCTTVFSTSGSFAPNAASPAPTGSSGCWPIGVWTFTAKIESNDCSPAPALSAQYQFRGEVTTNEDGDPVQSFKYMTDPAARHIVKVSQGGSGLCEGELSIYSADGKSVFLFKPALNADNTIAGDGEFGVFGDNQWPF